VYVVSAYVEASSLQEFQLTYEQSARILVKVCEAIEAAHAKGILHRNLKPTNIWLDGDGNPLVADFWPASRVPPGPEFLAPEQAAGNLKAVSRATDVYALGATLYYALTQHLPFPGESPEIVRRKVVDHELVPPRSWDKSMPLALEAIILKAMAREPERRYATVGQFGVDLRNYLERMPVAALVERSRKRATALVGAAAVLVLLAAGAWAILRTPAKPAPPPVANVPDDKPDAPLATKPSDQTPHPPPDLKPPEKTDDPPVEPAAPAPGKPAIPPSLLEELRALAGAHRHYLDSYFLPEERARVAELAKAGVADDGDLAWLRQRALGEVGAAIRADRETIDAIAAEGNAHAATLQREPGDPAAREALGFARAPSGFWRRETAASATAEGIRFEGRTYTRQQLRSTLLTRGYVHLNGAWCRRRGWTHAPAVKDLKVTLNGADVFTVYESRIETIHDPFSKINLQVKRFTPKSTYFGASDGEVVVTVDAPADFVECKVRAAAAVVGEGAVELWLSVPATAERAKLYAIAKGRHEEMVDVTPLVRGKRAFTLVAKLASPSDGRERRGARFLPSDAADGAPLDVRASLADPDAVITKLLGPEAPGPDPAQVRALVAQAADRLVGEKTTFAEALDRLRAEASMLVYEPQVETPMEYEGAARAIVDPLAFDPSKAPEKLASWWDGLTLPQRRGFAAWFGLWCAREGTRKK
jgi:hypothetical protein